MKYIAHANAIGLNNMYCVANTPSDIAEASTFDNQEDQVIVVMNKKVAAEIAKLIDKSIYEPHKSLAEAIKHFTK